TQYGRIAHLRVPKLRRGNRHLQWQTITRYEPCWGPLLDQHLLHDCLGHSLRDLQEVMQLSLGEVLSLAACHRIVLGLEERAHAFKTARLEAPAPNRARRWPVAQVGRGQRCVARGCQWAPAPSETQTATRDAHRPRHLARWSLGDALRALGHPGGCRILG